MVRRFVGISLAIVLPASLWAQGTATPYPTMAPVEQYRMDRAAEIALAKSAAPASISDSAEVLVMGAAGYETAQQGKNGFVCAVGRSWANDFDNADFWNPKARSPVCVNAAAARSYLPYYLTRTKWVLAGMTLARMKTATQPVKPEVGAMVYMLSKDGYLGDNVKGPWHPHLMFVYPRTPDGAWGANAPGSPVEEYDGPSALVTLFLIRVKHWSDGSPDSAP
ncbi:MAG TPA: hypothetical protein VH163_04760 [Gemmatimonadales bacterium]|jgi:hypothetical protein|nr:hypothetical protein [Gemmatimonadales bacterium]